MHREVKETEREYATCEDFLKLFDDNGPSLYLLSFLLTANWAHSWSRRLIVRSALRLVAPKSGSHGPAQGASQSADDL
jgi:hypothetical protein